MTTYEPKGIKFFSQSYKKEILYIEDESSSYNGWLCWKHPDGEWVTMRKANAQDLQDVEKVKLHNYIPIPQSEFKIPIETNNTDAWEPTEEEICEWLNSVLNELTPFKPHFGLNGVGRIVLKGRHALTTRIKEFEFKYEQEKELSNGLTDQLVAALEREKVKDKHLRTLIGMAISLHAESLCDSPTCPTLKELDEAKQALQAGKEGGV